MRVAFLNTEERIAQWFQKAYPGIHICKKADEQFQAAETLILNVSYKIDTEEFEILPMWKKFLEIRKNRKKLVVLGSTPFQSSNYLCINQMPQDLEAWLGTTLRVSQKPSYPENNENSILRPLSKILHSHGDRAFQKLLIRVRDPLMKVEIMIRKGHHRESIKITKEWEETSLMMASLSRIWEARQAYFTLMPEYPRLKKFYLIEKAWKEMATTFTVPSPKLSIQIMNYLEDTITDITGLYKMEK
ncbi:MAG: hypothetical protein KDE26_26280 [Bacteroidetes bacterium]|nr:hypothetical protein [Bacteroidota bacterium]MCB0846795.1 hypothetical protein [Bacteroidota bacterium]